MRTYSAPSDQRLCARSRRQMHQLSSPPEKSRTRPGHWSGAVRGVTVDDDVTGPTKEGGQADPEGEPPGGVEIAVGADPRVGFFDPVPTQCERGEEHVGQDRPDGSGDGADDGMLMRLHPQ